jgi:ring-1,2-phenylacetyl-CoA epoxidase subunit PaaD
MVSNQSNLFCNSYHQSVLPVQEKVWNLLNQIPDPDIPAVSIVELGLVSKVEVVKNGQSVRITLIPSYSGCPAMSVFIEDIKQALIKEHIDAKINVSLSPAWTTDLITAAGREKMRIHGIAPPQEDLQSDHLFEKRKAIHCPRCSSNHTHVISQFGSTPCKGLCYCKECEQPFEFFKCHR